MARAEALRVEVVYCPAPGRIDRTELRLAPGSTVGAALQASGVLQRHAIAPEAADVGVWCRAAALDSPLRDRDRVELYRPLTVDPKEARRLRYKRRAPKGERSSGRLSGSPKR
jgi:putative ubiquitin-RnfH superfamily antitoxin RatB of RatAB toxin-antitoxin module